MKRLLILICFIYPFLNSSIAQNVQIGNDTTIIAFQLTSIGPSNNSVTKTIEFPELHKKYEQIIMFYNYGCPAGGCDPFDRIANMNVIKDGETFEIARVMTPYNKACGWQVDVTDYRSLLAGSTQLNAFILTYVNGYNLSVSFAFIGGNPQREAYHVENLWGNTTSDRWEYGNPAIPIDDKFPTRTVFIPEYADSVKLKVTTTGHGQGNTYNSAEFYFNKHSAIVNFNDTITHTLKSVDCSKNSCAPQPGSWQYDRAGWCPGDVVPPWDVNINSYLNYSSNNTFQYKIEDYENLCRPGQTPCPCQDCNYNGNGHTKPWYLNQTQLIYYKEPYDTTNGAMVGVGMQEDEIFGEAINIYPNPVREYMTITVDLIFASYVDVRVSNLIGQTVAVARRENLNAGLNTIQTDMSNLIPGIYNVEVTTLSGSTTRKMVKK